ncbi:MAG: response regulator [Labilithrix sp.]|nr:response regulator [Labilithrix sp.]MCW5818223.1 response regulator [Labilithrix sp.]
MIDETALLCGVEVLLLEPYDDLREAVARWLTADGATVRTAPTASEGLAAVYRDPPDIVVTELLVLAGGASIVSALRRADERLPVLLTTSQSHRDVPPLLHAEICAYLQKPFDLPTLTRLVAGLSRRPR